MSKTKKIKTAVGVADRTDPYFALGASRVDSDKFWRWGDDNLFPAALALMARRSTTHRRIINDKADYISRSEEHTSELQSPPYISYAVFCLKKFFFNDTATTEIYTLSLHDALPIWRRWR